jgi:hypothetical protein
VAIGGRSSVRRVLAAQARDLVSIPGSFPVLFYIFQPAIVFNILPIISRLFHRYILGNIEQNTLHS